MFNSRNFLCSKRVSSLQDPFLTLAQSLLWREALVGFLAASAEEVDSSAPLSPRSPSVGRLSNATVELSSSGASAGGPAASSTPKKECRYES